MRRTFCDDELILPTSSFTTFLTLFLPISFLTRCFDLKPADDGLKQRVADAIKKGGRKGEVEVRMTVGTGLGIGSGGKGAGLGKEELVFFLVYQP